MIIDIAPWLFNLLFAFGFAGCGFMLGRILGEGRREQTIENTIFYLIENDYIKARKSDGELELIKLSEDVD